MILRPLLLALLFTSTLLAGCAGIPEPQPQTPGAALPLTIRNDRQEPAWVEVRVLEPAGRTAVLKHEDTVEPGAERTVTSPRVPYGPYILAISGTFGARESRIDFDEADRYFRFVLHEDVIAFQGG